MKHNPTQEMIERRREQVAFDHEDRRLRDRDRIPYYRIRGVMQAVKQMGLKP